MTQAKVNGVELEYETWGDSGGQPIFAGWGARHANLDMA